MIRKYFLPFLAVCGFSFAVWSVVNGSRPSTAAPPVAPPAESPFQTKVVGAGIVEASTENIAVGTPVAGVVSRVFVTYGARVKAGDPLFGIDDREMQAQLGLRQAELDVARQQLDRLLDLPRPEDVPPAEARVHEAQAALDDVAAQLALWERVPDKRAVSEDQLQRKRFAVSVARARLREAQSQLDLLKAGSWKPDIAIARAQIAAAEAAVRSVQTEIDRRLIRAPIDGQVLQLNVRPGEFAPAGATPTPLVLIGDVDLVHVRVDVDENEAWRVKPDAPAMAFVRGNPDLRTPLTFVRIEPYIVPKRSLTGESTERVDTRVLQVIYSFRRGSLPVYVGQQMDVFISAPPLHLATQPAAGSR